MSRAFVREDGGQEGFAWGAPELRPHVERILAWAESDGDERLMQLAERFLRVA